MVAVEKLLFVSEEAKKWIYHPMMKTVKPDALHQYKRSSPAAVISFFVDPA
jgi:hypothetical protein